MSAVLQNMKSFMHAIIVNYKALMRNAFEILQIKKINEKLRSVTTINENKI